MIKFSEIGEQILLQPIDFYHLSRWPVNPQVPGSSPGLGARIHGHFRRNARFILFRKKKFVPEKFAGAQNCIIKTVAPAASPVPPFHTPEPDALRI